MFLFFKIFLCFIFFFSPEISSLAPSHLIDKNSLYLQEDLSFFSQLTTPSPSTSSHHHHHTSFFSPSPPSDASSFKKNLHSISSLFSCLLHLREKTAVLLFFFVLCIVFFIFSFLHHSLHLPQLDIAFLCLSFITIIIYTLPGTLQFIFQFFHSIFSHIKKRTLPKTFDTEKIEHFIQCIVVFCLIIIPPLMTQYDLDIVLDLALVAAMISFIFFAIHHLIEALIDHKNYESEITALWDTLPRQIHVVRYNNQPCDYWVDSILLEQHLGENFNFDSCPIIIDISQTKKIPLVDGTLYTDTPVKVRNYLVSGNHSSLKKQQFEPIFGGSDISLSPNSLMQVTSLGYSTLLGQAFKSQQWDEEHHTHKQFNLAGLTPLLLFIILLVLGSIFLISLVSTDTLSMHLVEGYGITARLLIIPLILSIAICISPFVIGLPLTKTILSRYLSNHGLSLSSLPILFTSIPSFFALDVNGTLAENFVVDDFNSLSGQDTATNLEILAILATIQSRKDSNIYAQAMASFFEQQKVSIQHPLLDFKVTFDRNCGFSYADINGERFVFGEVQNFQGKHTGFASYYPSDLFQSYLPHQWIFFKHSLLSPDTITPLFSWNFKKDRLRKGVTPFLENLYFQHDITPFFITGAKESNALPIIEDLHLNYSPLTFCEVSPPEKATIIHFFQIYGKKLRPILDSYPEKATTWNSFCHFLQNDSETPSTWRKHLQSFSSSSQKKSFFRSLYHTPIAYIGDGPNDCHALQQSGTWGFSFQSEFHSSPLCRKNAHILIKGSPDRYFNSILFYFRSYLYARSFSIFALSFAVLYAILSILMVGFVGGQLSVVMHSVSELLTFIFPLILILILILRSPKNRSKILPFINECFFILWAHKKIITYTSMLILSLLSILILAIILPAPFQPLCLLSPIGICLVLLPFLWLPSVSLDKRYDKMSFSDRINRHNLSTHDPETSFNQEHSFESSLSLPSATSIQNQESPHQGSPSVLIPSNLPNLNMNYSIEIYS